MLDRLIGWAERDPNIRALVLVGSRAIGTPPDDLADFDLQVYAETIEPYVADSGWLAGIRPVWLWVPDEYDDAGMRVRTLLVIFDAGVKVDFAFYRADGVSEGLRRGLPHRVLVDKDGRSREMAPRPETLASQSQPAEADFSRALSEFWFEAYHVGKYLARGELWLAKSRDWAAKQQLLRVIAWTTQPSTEGDPFPDAGKNLRERVRGETWDELHEIFGGVGRAEGWRALFATIELFRKFAREVAAQRGFVYPKDVDRKLSDFLASLRDAGLEGAP